MIGGILMNYNKEKFLEILDRIKLTFGSQNKMADALEISSSYITKIYDENTKNPPAPEYLQKIANNSRGITHYQELMQICGYSKETMESIVNNIYNQLKQLSLTIYKKNNKDFYEVESSIETFQEYSKDLIDSIQQNKHSQILFRDYYNKDRFLDDDNYVCSFLFLFEAFLQCIEKENYLTIINYPYTDWLDNESLYQKLLSVEDLKNMQLLSNSSDYANLNLTFQKDLLQYIKKFTTCLNLAYLSDFDNNTLTELFKKKASHQQSTQTQKKKDVDPLGLSEIGFDINSYIPPTPTQKEQIKAMIEIILKENKKKEDT